MADIPRMRLFGKLNSLAYKNLESATVFCKLRGNPYVELVHWVHQLLQAQDSDLHRIVRHYGLNLSRLAQDVTGALDALPRGATAVANFSPHLDDSVQQAWICATLLFGESQVRTGHLLVGWLRTGTLRQVVLGISGEFSKIKLEELSEKFAEIVSGSPEDRLTAKDGSTLGAAAAGPAGEGGTAPAQLGKQEALNKYATDLTEKARKGEIDPVTGRDVEIRQIIDILMRRRQNNPILTGEAGVGKTAVVEGLALRLAKGDVPPSLRDVSLRTLDLGLLQAGASMKGEFENRLRQVIDEVQASPKPIIMFIDEAHMLIGAGGAAGQGDAANLLKPALARGTLRTIAATTWAEYKKYFEKDPALTRRFQVVKVEEPSEATAVLMMRGLTSRLEKHHKVAILDDGIAASVTLSHRYIPARQLPDKAVSLLDTAAARVAISQHATPPSVEDTTRVIEALTTEQELLTKEQQAGGTHTARLAEITAALATQNERLASLTADWKKELDLVAQILAIRTQLAAPDAPPPAPAAADAKAPAVPPAPAAPPVDRVALRASLDGLMAELIKLQGDHPLILPWVDAQAVAAVVADWTGIPVGKMVKDEIDAILKLADHMERRVIGQRDALEAIAKRVQTSRARLDNPNRPVGVFLLAGPSGVGKTETALALAELLFGDEQSLITINMSEFQEAHTVSTLKGSPPGYVGYGEGGVLTEAVRRRPYSVVLLDEVEKAHKDVHEIFFQVFDKGQMEDGEGRMIDFKNTLILLTSNVGSDLIMGMCKDPELLPAPEGVAAALRAPLLKVFPAALLGRLVVTPYFPITPAVLQQIIRLQLKRIAQRLQQHHKVPLVYDDTVIQLIATRCTELESGARMVDAILTHTLLPAISQQLLQRMLAGQPLTTVEVKVVDNDFAFVVS